MGSNRRLDVQGLRALAVLMVVAYHAGLPVPGGFVGVDVFFVISGFVITAMLRREWEQTGRIRFGAFYLRRFKRLTPALATMVAITTVTAGLVLSPLGPQQRAAHTGLGAMALVANWVIASSTGGYFDPPAATNPLLHTWSLSLEEQFYLLFPAVLALCWRFRRSPRVWVATIGLLSFAVVFFSLATLGRSSWFGFYSPLSRAWEFAAGALLALVPLRVPRAVQFVGLGLLAASLWLINDRAPFPSAWALLPVLGAVAVIAAGSRVLSVRPLVRIGDWSYSIYLWHWPLIVFATAFYPARPHARIVAAAVSFAPALASYRWIERPFRSLQLPRPRLAVAVAVVIASPLMLAGAVGAVANDVWTPRYVHGEMPVAHAGDIGQGPFFAYLGANSVPCARADLQAQALRYRGVLRCRQTRPGPVDVAVIGDSHAEHLFTGLADALRTENVSYDMVVAAPALNDATFARIVRDVTASQSIRVIVLNAFWYGRPIDGEQLTATLRALTRTGKPVYVTDDIPFFNFDPFECKYRQALLEPTTCTIDARQFHASYEQYYPKVAASVRRVRGAHLLHTVRLFCGRQTCAMTYRGALLFRDPIHLNLTGSRFVAQQLLARYPAFAAAVSAG
jgi:peptidoglycan/LPS O-acetylase OafA/YrhL